MIGGIVISRSAAETVASRLTAHAIVLDDAVVNSIDRQTDDASGNSVVLNRARISDIDGGAPGVKTDDDTKGDLVRIPDDLIVRVR